MLFFLCGLRCHSATPPKQFKTIPVQQQRSPSVAARRGCFFVLLLRLLRLLVIKCQSPSFEVSIAIRPAPAKRKHTHSGTAVTDALSDRSLRLLLLQRLLRLLAMICLSLSSGFFIPIRPACCGCCRCCCDRNHFFAFEGVRCCCTAVRLFLFCEQQLQSQQPQQRQQQHCTSAEGARCCCTAVRLFLFLAGGRPDGNEESKEKRQHSHDSGQASLHGMVYTHPSSRIIPR